MSMVVEVVPHERILHLRVRGEFTLVEANACIRSGFELLARNPRAKVLVDYRGLTGSLTTMERFEHSRQLVEALGKAAEQGVSRGIRVAYVGSGSLLDQERFGEMVAVNRGMNLKVTDDFEEALRWLEEAPATT